MLKRGLAGAGVLAIGLALAATPVTVRVGDGITVEKSYAWAKRGSDDRGRDDHGGRGRGGDDRGKDDRGGKGKGRDDRGNDDRGGKDGGRGGNGGVVKVEQQGRNIEVTFANGVKVEIEGNRYERKNRAGDTVVERRATAQDRARLEAIVAGRGGNGGGGARPGGDGRVVKVEQQGRNIEVTFASGVKVEIEGNRFERKNRAGDTVVERRATPQDRARLEAMAARR